MVFTSKPNIEITKSEILLKKRDKNFCGFFSIWRHPRKGMVQCFPNTYFQKRWFLLANTTWKWQNVKNYWKKQTSKQKKKGFFSIWRHSKKGVVESSSNAFFQKRWFLLVKTTWTDKKWKIIEKKTKKIFRKFFWFDVIQERVCFRAFLTPIFNKLFRTTFK